MEVDSLEPVQLGESTQWIRILAANSRNPLLLLVQMGPGLPMIELTHTLTGLNCPIVMVQGRHDQVTPASSAERYACLVQAPSEQLVWFEHSAHMPHLEEPERFRQVLAKVRLARSPRQDDPRGVP
jgi:pimeloyl-ACP methyl ester carboxylesterase